MTTTCFEHGTAMVSITSLPTDAWREYKLLRLRALTTDPQAFEASCADQCALPDTYWQSQL